MKIAFLGDSITYGHGLEDPKDRYSTKVAEALGMEEENFGISGALVAKAGFNGKGEEAEKSFVSRVRCLDEAEVAVIFGGTNDYFWSDRPIAGEGEEYFEFALRSIARRVKEKRAGKVTLFVTPYPHNGTGNYWGGAAWNKANTHDTHEKNFNGHVISDYVRTIMKVCEEQALPCLNLHESFPFDWRVHTLDGCHPNAEGHRLLAEAVTAKLRELTEEAKKA